jgi:hypothetical protein
MLLLHFPPPSHNATRMRIMLPPHCLSCNDSFPHQRLSAACHQLQPQRPPLLYAIEVNVTHRHHCHPPYVAMVWVLTWPPGGKGHLLIVRTSKSLDLCPSPPRHMITKLKGSTETHIWFPRFPPTRHTLLTKKVNRGGGTAATRGQQSHPL